MQKMLCVGEIVNTHGVKGELKVVPLLDEPKDLLEFSHIFINNKEYEIENVRFHKDFALIKLKGIDDMDVTQQFKQKFMELPREELKPLPDGRYYVCDLIGLKVIDKEEVGFPYCIGSIGAKIVGDSGNEYGYATGAKTIKYTVEVTA